MKRAIFVFIVTLFVFSQPSLANFTQDIDSTAKNIATQTENLRPSLVRLALSAFYHARHLGVHTTKPVMTIIDYSLASTKKRLWVLDLEHNQVLYSSLVAHGRHSGTNYTTSFSNRVGSLQTSLGLFLTENTYFGHDGYSLRLKGLETNFNDNAEKRTIVLHGAQYVSKEFANTYGRLGTSWGCPAVEKQKAEPIIDTIKNGTLIFSYYPDSNWLKKSRFISRQA